MMPRQNNPKPKQRAVGGLAGLSKAQLEAAKRIKAMTPAQRKAYQAENKKNAVKVALAAAGMIPAGRAAKVVTGGVRNAQRLQRIKAQGRLTRTMRTTGQLKNEGSKFEFTTKANSIRQGKKISTKYANRYASQTKDKAINVVTQQKATGPVNSKGLSKMGKALSNSVPPKRITPASQPSSKLIQNIGRQSALRKKFPDKFKP
jgi:hypothetical protein